MTRRGAQKRKQVHFKGLTSYGDILCLFCILTHEAVEKEVLGYIAHCSPYERVWKVFMKSISQRLEMLEDEDDLH